MPRPVSTTAPTVSSASAARRAAVTSWYIAVSKALRTSGRLKAMTRTPGARLLDLNPARRHGGGSGLGARLPWRGGG